MNIDYENFTRSSFETVTVQNQIECSLNLSAEHYDKIFSLSGFISGDNPRTDGASTVFSGKAYFNAVFQAEELERVEAGARFEFKREQSDGLLVQWVDYALEGITLKKEGGTLYAQAVVTARITYRQDEDVRYCASTDILAKTETFTADKAYSCRALYDIEDEFEISKVKNVLYSKAEVAVTSVKATENAILVDGDAVLSLVLLPFSENSDIVNERRTIPFRFEVDCKECAPDMSAFCMAAVKNVGLKVYTDEETGKSQVSSRIAVSFFGGAVSSCEMEKVVDIYSESCDLSVAAVRVDNCKFLGQRAFSEKIFGRMDADVPEYSRFIRFIGEGVEVTDYNLIDGELVINGAIYGDGIFSGENGIISKPATMAFEIKRGVDGDFISCLSVSLDGALVKQRSGALEGDFSLKLSYLEYAQNPTFAITQIDEGEQKSVNKSVITVYLGKKGDEEWDVVKALGEPIEDIRTFNPTLEFPLGGGEKIMIFRRR